jgi:pyridoxamine 5'-phosphate oxidase
VPERCLQCCASGRGVNVSAATAWDGAEDAADPLARFRELLAQAVQCEAADATAMALATADGHGRPSVRMVLLKAADGRGFVFCTNLSSRKARELAENPQAALCIHWPALGMQVRAEGVVEPVPDVDADAYFAARPRGSRIGAWASLQSQPLGSREELLARYRESEVRFSSTVPRPPFWGGYRLVPVAIEFWRSDEHRLHHRLLYRGAPGGWARELLYP